MSMRVDAYTHFFPERFFTKLNEVAGDYKDMGKRIRSLPALFDLDVRKKIVDGHKDYQQILSYPQPPVERFAKTSADIDEFCRIINDGFAELIAKEKDHFPGWVAQVSLDGARRRRRRSGARVEDGRTRRADLHQCRRQTARPAAIRPVLEKNERTRRTDLATSGARRRDAGLSRREKSLYEIWWTIGWSYETACAMLRLVYSKIMDTYPNLKIITHHFAGIVPMLEGRLGPGNDVMGNRTTDHDYVGLRKSLKKRPLDYFKNDFWADTAAFTAEPATKCGMEFFPIDKIVFASDCPFDPEGGTMFPRETLRILDSLKMDKTTSDKVFYKNLEAVTGKTLVK